MKDVRLFIIAASFLLAGCATINPYLLSFSPLPENIDSYSELCPDDIADSPFGRPVLYATTRNFLSADTPPFYGSQREPAIHLGRSIIRLADENITWSQLDQAEESDFWEQSGVLSVSEVTPLGVLSCNDALFARESCEKEQVSLFLEELNGNINKTESKELVLFVHGYNTQFVYPLQVVSQYRHYADYSMEFMIYSWPSLAHISGYGADLETIETQVRGFRQFLEFLSENTEAEKIHIIAHSAGTRLVMQALNQLRLINSGKSSNELSSDYRLGQLLIAASDMDRETFGSFLSDGVLDMVEQMNVYISRNDSILETSNVYHNYSRLGQYWEKDQFSPETAIFLEKEDRIHFIDVSSAPGNKNLGGHFYFLESPWVSSDILNVLIKQKIPEERALIGDPANLEFWSFPADYAQKVPSL